MTPSDSTRAPPGPTVVDESGMTGGGSAKAAIVDTGVAAVNPDGRKVAAVVGNEDVGAEEVPEHATNAASRRDVTQDRRTRRCMLQILPSVGRTRGA